MNGLCYPLFYLDYLKYLLTAFFTSVLSFSQSNIWKRCRTKQAYKWRQDYITEWWQKTTKLLPTWAATSFGRTQWYTRWHYL